MSFKLIARALEPPAIGFVRIVRGAQAPAPQRRKLLQQAGQTVPLVLNDHAARCRVFFIIDAVSAYEQIYHHLVGAVAAANGIDASVQFACHIGLIKLTVRRTGHVQFDEAMQRVLRVLIIRGGRETREVYSNAVLASLALASGAEEAAFLTQPVSAVAGAFLMQARVSSHPCVP